MKKRMGRKKKAAVILGGAAAVIAVVLFVLADYWNLLPKKSYTAEDFGITTIQSSVDFNRNGIDDYTDLMFGARQDAVNHPAYDGAYWEGGYPPEDIGVCTDVIWRAFRNAGYCLKDMVDNDILMRPEAYTNITEPDPNIDFRRVKNLHVFFEAYAVSLTTDLSELSEWQPGDIVIFGDDKHIGIISDKRNKHGEPYIIHNGGQPKREEDYLHRTTMSVTAHYRFDASLIDPELLIFWEGTDWMGNEVLGENTDLAAGAVSADAVTSEETAEENEDSAMSSDAEEQGSGAAEGESGVDGEEDVLIEADGEYVLTETVSVSPERELTLKLHGKKTSDYFFGIREIEVFDGDRLLQTIVTEEAVLSEWGDSFMTDTAYTESWSRDGDLYMLDMNFDGFLDLGLMAWSGYNLPYYYWLWNEEEECFEYAFCLNSVSLTFDTEKEQIISWQKDGALTHYSDYYAYDEDGELQLRKTIEETFDEDGNLVTKTYEMIDGEWQLTEESE